MDETLNLLKNALVKARKEGKKIIITSDFDETITTSYSYDLATKQHEPFIRPNISHLTQQLSSHGVPLIICTSRGVDDAFISKISKLSSFPMVIENGGGFFDDNKFEIILNEDVLKTVENLKNEIRSKKSLINLPDFLEILIHINRVTGIEFRIQNKNGKGIKGDDLHFYDDLRNTVKSLNYFDPIFFELTFTGSTLTVQPKGVNKATGVLRLFKKLNLNREDYFIVGIGDAENDIPLMNLADYGVAVAIQSLPGAKAHIPTRDNATEQIFSIIQTVYA